ncbi:amidase family protein [Candidatus Contubernalis alkaliaceticus]|uniref:amidase family protein n=1 Tax=Candidatus Contubernalis alkaliaceticus TaxID=338645 RepID=UPI001F4C3BF9|nr:amidase family protein [Candidatus Contubernalis alkalaceticus]UNC91491.1 Asp-tRNA(Asn)/Glu-tRNA(Gln) amidotransferase subunit GatA [Candidatus Contubernalis alkalaceticus]
MKISKGCTKEKICPKEADLKELARIVYDRAKMAEENYNAFITLDEQYLNSQVEKLSAGEKDDKKPLSGIPAVLGDNLCTEGIRTTCGSKILENYTSPFNALVADRLQEAGSIIVGKTNIDEFGIGDSRGISHFGRVKNPWDANHTAGSGTACAVASGSAVFGLGSDARGGLRQSAAYSGLGGLKPSFGRISRWGLIDYAPSLDQIGIIAKTAMDMALVLECIAGEDYRDSSTLKNPAPGYLDLLEENPADIKIGLLKGYDVESLEPEVKALFEKELARLKDIGCSIVEVELPNFLKSSTTASIIGAVEAYSNLANFDGVRFGYRGSSKHLQEMYIKSRTEGFGSFLKKYLTFGALASAEDHIKEIFNPAQKMRTKIKEELEEALKTVDMVVTPTVPFRAPVFSNLDSFYGIDSHAHTFTAAVNLAGLPALTVPVKADQDLPTGLQLIGRAFEEGKLLNVWKALDK